MAADQLGLEIVRTAASPKVAACSAPSAASPEHQLRLLADARFVLAVIGSAGVASGSEYRICLSIDAVFAIGNRICLGRGLDGG